MVSPLEYCSIFIYQENNQDYLLMALFKGISNKFSKLLIIYIKKQIKNQDYNHWIKDFKSYKKLRFVLIISSILLN